MKKIYLGTNTKMYKNIGGTVAFLEELGRLTKNISRRELELFVIPSFTTLETAGRLGEQQNIRIGAQNMGWADEGQFTGEISPLMLREVGVTIAEIAHSERRQLFGETDEAANQKVHAALRHGITALLCIGETRQQKELGIADEILRLQLKVGLHSLRKQDLASVWIAYEPVWAIGVNGEPATPEYAADKHRVIVDTLSELFGPNEVPLLYGGSVNPGNAAQLAGLPHVDGLFIGRSAWNAESFNHIIRSVLPVFRAKAAVSISA